MKKVTKIYEISIFTVQLLKMASYYENETDFYVKFKQISDTQARTSIT